MKFWSCQKSLIRRKMCSNAKIRQETKIALTLADKTRSPKRQASTMINICQAMDKDWSEDTQQSRIKANLLSQIYLEMSKNLKFLNLNPYRWPPIYPTIARISTKRNTTRILTFLVLNGMTTSIIGFMAWIDLRIRPWAFQAMKNQTPRLRESAQSRQYW